MITRKDFLKQVSAVSAGIGLGGLTPLTAYSAQSRNRVLSIMHTNDTHARIDPFPEGSGDFAGLGGITRRAALINKLRDKRPNNLLLDAGDTFQGTPYFNFYGGALDFELMSMMGYDASTIGNHEFDNRVEGFVEVAPKAQFPFVISNYDFTGAPEMGAFCRPYMIRDVDGIRVGILGIGVAFEALVLPQLHEGVEYLQPIPVAERIVHTLRSDYACDLVICLSHIGYEYETDQISDRDVAEAVDGIDLIIGGHTHTLLDEPSLIEKPGQLPTIISQVGHAGVVLGHLDFEFSPSGKIARVSSANHTIA